VFLGTAGNLGVVKTRSSGGFVIQLKDSQLHVDPGPGALTNAGYFGVNVRAHTGILVSHAHLNHSSDLNSLISAMTLNGLDNHGVLVAPESVIKGAGSMKPVLSDHHAKQLEKIIVAQPNKKFALNDIEVHALTTKHHDPHAVGFKIFTPEFVLAYTGDTDYVPELPDVYSGADILVVNCQHPGKSKEPGLCAQDVIKILKKAAPKLCVLTHFGQKMLDAGPLYEAREIQKQSGVQVIAAQDGMSVNPVSYSAELKQKTLNLFTAGKEERSQQGTLR
jgi:ribonuclease BN (tRNA processing enzyme)